jgi:hypothetical protein
VYRTDQHVAAGAGVSSRAAATGGKVVSKIQYKINVPHAYRGKAIGMVDATEPLPFTVLRIDNKPRYKLDEFKCALSNAVMRLPSVLAVQTKRSRVYVLHDDMIVRRYQTPKLIQAAFDRGLLKIPPEGIPDVLNPVSPHARLGTKQYAQKLRADRVRAKVKRAENKKKRTYRMGELELSLRHGSGKCAFLPTNS